MEDRVATLTLNRTDRGNALSTELMLQLISAVNECEADDGIGCIIITGKGKFFSAGADISEMREKTFLDMFKSDFFSGWDRFCDSRKPKIAAVNGLALGGGCELAMMCDLIFTSDIAQFGQPEIKLGVISGIGASQRLTQLVGKSVAMDLILTGRNITAEEALRIGLASRMFSNDELLEETMSVAKEIAEFSPTAVTAGKECVDLALEVGLKEGLVIERRIFHSLFATEDQKEGMDAFFNKRKPVFTGK